MRAALAILKKDLRIEWRTRESVSSLVALGILLLVVFTIAHDPTPEEQPRLAPSVLWATFVFTGLLGVQRGFLLEREQDCWRTSASSPSCKRSSCRSWRSCCTSTSWPCCRACSSC